MSHVAIREVARAAEKTTEKTGERLERAERPADKPPAERPADRPIRHPEAHSARNPANAPAERALFDDNRKAMEYGLDNAACSPHGLKGDYGKLQGALGEGLHHYTRGGGVGLVHDLNAELDVNNPVFDASSRAELTSIKTHLGVRERASLGNYAEDLRVMVGAKDGHKVGAFADKVWAMKREGGEAWRRAEAYLPQHVREAASPAEMRTAVVDDAVLRVPADQVATARAYVLRVAQARPELYGIDPAAGAVEKETRAAMLAMKIRPLADGVSGREIRVMTRELYQRRYNLT